MSPVAETVRSGSSLVDVVWRPAGLSPASWPDVLAGPLTSKPLVLLVNSNSASASEVLAGGVFEARCALAGMRCVGWEVCRQCCWWLWQLGSCRLQGTVHCAVQVPSPMPGSIQYEQLRTNSVR